MPGLKEKLAEKEKRLNELNQEFLAGKQVLTESLKDAVNEAKRQYDAIDSALEVSCKKLINSFTNKYVL